jgi:hypothetical protein
VDDGEAGRRVPAVFLPAAIPRKKTKAGAAPAFTELHVTLNFGLRETLARSVHAPGGWGAEESGTRSEPGPEATVVHFAVQLGTCLAEIGPYYVSA